MSSDSDITTHNDDNQGSSGLSHLLLLIIINGMGRTHSIRADESCDDDFYDDYDDDACDIKIMLYYAGASECD